nr:MAG: hypothetical protein [Microvirus sp.]
MKEIVDYCAYCNTLTFQEYYEDQQIKICKTCEMEAAQLVIWPTDTKKIVKKQIDDYKKAKKEAYEQVINTLSTAIEDTNKLIMSKL